MDKLVGVAGKKTNYEEPESCGSAANFYSARKWREIFMMNRAAPEALLEFLLLTLPLWTSQLD